MMPERPIFACSLWALLALSIGYGPRALSLDRQPRPPDPPRLVLLVVIDQLRYDYLTRFDDLYTGGFRTLLERGALMTEARYRHGVNATAAGHATIVTGRHPSRHGVVGNSWYDSTLGRRATAAGDPDYEPVGGPGAKASPRNLLAPTVGDWLKRREPLSKVVAIGTKARAAVILAGGKGDAAYWFSDDCGCLITSSYFVSQAPAWLTRFRLNRRADSYLGKTWTHLLADPALYLRRSREDDFPAENGGLGMTFPHVPENFSQFKKTPHNDEFLLDAVIAAMEFHELGRDSTPDLLAVGFSATDAIGHSFGPFSQEAMDQHLRLDRLLARLWGEVERKVGLDHTMVVVTSDHGVSPLAAQARRQGHAAEVVPSSLFQTTVDRAVTEKFQRDGCVVAYVDAVHVTLDLKAIESLGLERRAVELAGKKALLELDSVAAVYTQADLLSELDDGDPYRKLYRNAVHAGRSPHLLVQMKPFHYPRKNRGPTLHISAHDYDRHVPIFFMGRGVAQGRYDTPCGPEDIAPTLAAFLRLDIAPDPDARVLQELILEPAGR